MNGRDAGGEDDAFSGCLAGNLRAATRVITRLYDDQLRPCGLRITQVAILVQIRHNQPVSVADLASNLSAERSAVARDVHLLERDGLVRSDERASDRRVREICLTELGEQRLRDVAPAWRSAQDHVRSTLGPEAADELVDLARRVTDQLSTLRGPRHVQR